MSIGYDYALGGKVSAGITSFVLESGVGGFTAAGLRLHYYPNGTFQNGWVYGLDIFRSIDTRTIFDEDEENFINGFFSVGYGFK